ncbi:glycoside hydrolase family 3 N-terminal domain-containing protein [Galbitalea sp. SE-J8]|uniref:glycoside hydrolase family 3 N-terminal domain-containing protein n=1 Tax=Galbitalea sp. SE-J8 TaxID=3054952 RepID=UPI00259CED1F|nr:glycoside hydrolase family 3 N-terminal domain-containing protein [Galbitalea sp. SE-J8]MDM4762154.1 glycoside hydrolase family 3 N-terminal domain-containing protein [Galbitalea sp. SE-J8]
MLRRSASVCLALVLLALAGCSPSPAPAPSGPAPTTPAPTSPAPTTPATPDPIAGMSLAEEVGALFVVGAPAAGDDSTARRLVRDRSVGGVFLSGRSTAGVAATARVVQRLRDAGGDRPLLVATDQEGGQVQVLSGPGFDTIPSALDQGAVDPAVLRGRAAGWGRQLRAAGVDVDLAPVADVVRSADADNPPIAAFDREYGTSADAVAAHAGAVADGLRDAGVTPTFKHFPGLGYVDGNTDTTAGVTDAVTGADGPTAASFARLAAAGPSLVMVSSAIYARIDGSAPAVFSPTVVTGLLRQQLAFDGLVITDDISGATQLAAWSPADRAILALTAGCDLLLVSRTPAVADPMIDGVVARAGSDPAFRTVVDAAARRVLAGEAALRPDR